MNAITFDPKAIFFAALDQPSLAERLRYLDETCGSNSQLRARVEQLLAAHDEAGQFLGGSGATINTPLPERPGTQIGPYKLLQQIGEGGMGVVYMAEQTEPIARRVALKIIKPGMDTRQVIARFEAERQALAMMDHVNIARVLDAGTTEQGRPYFVMELVHGVPITKYCDDNRLTPRQRLQLFVPVCHAIQHAHQKGIIHRDIKPSNVMVSLYDGMPVPKVIDFGVAKATEQMLTERTLFTQYGTLVGTLEYMSPEQAEMSALGADTRSDIYSLGVLLYELLTGNTPLSHKTMKEAAYAEILRMIKEEEPQKPSTRLSDSGEALASISANRHTEPAKLSKLVRGELDWIVMKTLEKDRNRRYETANGLAMDIQRYLHDEPVLACPPSAGYRLRKFMRRNKSAMAIAALILFFVTLLGSGAGWAVRDRGARETAARQQRQAREAEMARERQERETEVAREKATRQTLIKERVTLAIEEARKRHQEGRWREALDAAKRADALAAAGDSDEATNQPAREVLGDMQMLANVEVVRVNSTKNDAGFDLKEEDSGIARAFREYGIDIDALDRDEAAKRIRARSIHYELAVFLDSWSHVRRRLERQGSMPTGKDWRELLEVARAVDLDPWRDRFRNAVLNDDRRALIELAALAPIASLPAETVDRLGDALIGGRAIHEAAAFLKKGQRLHPQDYWINVNLGNCLAQLGPQDLDEAIRYYTAAVALRPESVISHSNLGDALAKQGKPDEAAAAYGEAETIRLKAVVAACREAVRLKPDNHLAHYNLGVVLCKQGKLDEAIAAYREAVRLEPDLLAKEIVANLAFHFVVCSEPMACDPKRAIELVEQLMAQNPIIAQNPNAVLLASLLASSAPMLLLADDPDTYRQLCSRVIEKMGDTKEPRTAYLVARICALAPDAAPDARKVVQIAERAVRADPVPHHLHTLGLAHYRAGQFDAAIQELHKSIDGNWSANVANWLVLAMAHQRLGHADEARKWFDKAVWWIENSGLEAPRDSVDALRSLHRHDSLACMVLRREAEALLGPQPQSAPCSQEAPVEKE